MPWVFNFQRTDGRTLKIERMNPNITDLVFLLAGLKPVLYTHINPRDVPFIKRLALFFDLRTIFEKRTNAGSPNSFSQRASTLLKMTCCAARSSPGSTGAPTVRRFTCCTCSRGIHAATIAKRALN